tara:strand:+ start:82 stop:243 length:162 start_codon:yes stop_codon:yes gene_type:complete
MKDKKGKGIKKRLGDKPKVGAINKDEALKRMWSDNNIIGSDNYGTEEESKKKT